MASFRFLYVESDNPRAAMDALKLFVDGGLPSLPSAEPDRGDEEFEDEEGAESIEAEEPATDDDEPSELDDPTDIEDEPPAKRGRPMIPEREKAAALLSEGVPIVKVAEQLGVHRNTVRKIKQSAENGSLDQGGTLVKPKLIEVLGANPDGMTVDELVEATGVDKKRVQGGLFNHRGKAFVRSEAGVWTLAAVEERPQPATEPRKSAAALPLEAQANMIATLLKSDQPLDLAEISRTTRIPQADCFQILKGESFERDTDGMYWIAK